MPALTAVSTPAGAAQTWELWSCTMRLVVGEPAALPAARRLVDRELQAVEDAASRFRPDSEITALAARAGRPTRISQTLANLLGAALDAARDTGGAVDPTLGHPLAALGYDRDIALVRAAGPGVTVRRRPSPGWTRIHLDTERREVTVQDGVVIDVGATAKAWAADRCARVVAHTLGTPVLVSLGGDIATAGGDPGRPWQILVQDRREDPAAQIGLAVGAAVATSSTQSRQWHCEGHQLHHILDPRTALPVAPVWRSVSVVADSALEANTWSTAAIVRGEQA
ncbi:MAG TPA: FAD:protein FMN transferase, partial [Candidatus Lustribacter sp.]|nr:FAD:protein FMN transferase [Candidatus Lustribacter sp.]